MTEQQFAMRFVGRNRSVWKREVGIRLGDVANAQWFDDVDSAIETALETDLVPVSGVIELLSDFNIPMCVASNSSHARIESELRRTGLWPYFAGRCFSADDVGWAKPAPDLFLHAAQSCGISSSECVVVEDSPAGVEAARAAGMKCFVYTNGLIDATHFADAEAIPFSDMRNLRQLLIDK